MSLRKRPIPDVLTAALGIEDPKPAATRHLFMAPEHIYLMLAHAAQRFVLTLEQRDRTNTSATAMRQFFDDLMQDGLTEIDGKAMMHMPAGYMNEKYGEWVEVVPALNGWIDCLSRIAPGLPSTALQAIRDAIAADQDLGEYLVMAARLEFEAHVAHMKTMRPSEIDAAIEATRSEWRKQEMEKTMNTNTETQPINAAHELLLRAKDAMSTTDVARELNGTAKPNKSQIKAAEKLLKELNGLGLIEAKARAGGVPFYSLIVLQAEKPVVEVGDMNVVELIADAEPQERVLTPGAQADAPAAEPIDWTAPELTYLAPEDYELPPPDPALLAAANRALGEQLEAVKAELEVERVRLAACGVVAMSDTPESAKKARDMREEYRSASCDDVARRVDECMEFRAQLSSIAETVAEYLPDPSDISTARAVEILSQLADTHLAYIDRLSCKTESMLIAHCLLEDNNQALKRERTDLCERLNAHQQEIERLSAENLALKTLEGTMPGFGAAHDAQRIASLTAELQALRTSSANAINEADRLRTELAAERQAREALQEQAGDDAVDVKDAAVGYLVRVPKRRPILRSKPEGARTAALAAVRAGAARADVLAVVPVGTARRGAEWSAS